MRLSILALIALPLALFSAKATAQSTADEILGQWYTEDNASKVHVVKRNGTYYGTIIWLDEPEYSADDPEAGKTRHDRKNPDAKKKSAPLIGLRVLKNFTYNAPDKTWDDGTIYDPENGRTYKCVVRFKDDPKGVDGKALHVRGYIGFPALGRTTVWYRVPPKEMEKVDSE